MKICLIFSMLIILFASCENKKHRVYHSSIDNFVVDYHNNSIVISGNGVKDTLSIRDGNVYDSQGILVFTTAKDTIVEFNVDHFHVETIIKKRKGEKCLYESRNYIDDGVSEKRLSFIYIYNDKYEIIEIQHPMLVDFICEK